MKNEIKKIIFSKKYISMIIIGVIIVLFHSYKQIMTYNDFIEAYKQSFNEEDFILNPHSPIISSFTLWIGNDENYIAKIYYYMFPLISVIPCTRLFVSKRNNDQLVTDSKKIYFTIFISSGLIMIITPLLDFIIISLFVPSIYPDSIYDIYYGLFSNDFSANLFYEIPYLFVLEFLVIDFVFCGLIGCLAYTISVLIKRKVLSVVMTSFLLILIDVVNRFLIKVQLCSNIIISPFSFIYPIKSNNCNWIVILCEFLIIYFLSYYITVVRKEKITKISNNYGVSYEEKSDN